MFFAALDRLRGGTLVCVFDATDRVQHMFWRTSGGILHPRRETARKRTRSASNIAATTRFSASDVAPEGWRRVDGALATTASTSFRRGVNLNRWLLVTAISR